MNRHRSFVGGCLALLTSVTLCGTAVGAPILTQAGNGLGNGSFESGTANAVTGSGGVWSAASTWRQWENSTSGSPITELISETDMMNEFGIGMIDGNRAVRVTTQGGSDGLFTFWNYGHPGWSLFDSVSFSAWVYVISGTMQVAVGSNQNGFSSNLISATGGWQFVTVTSGAGQRNDEALLYSAAGASEFIVDSAWLNNGELSNHPLQSLSTQVPEPPMLALFLSGAMLLTVAGRRRLKTA